MTSETGPDRYHDTWTVSAPLDYRDPALDFFSAKHRIIEYLKARHGVDSESLEHSVIQDLIDNWAYCADRLSQANYSTSTKEGT